MINAENVISYLRDNAFGRENAIYGADLGDEFGLLAPQIRVIVNNARRDGIPICTCGHGYFFAKDASDIKATIEGLYGRIESVLAAIDGLQGALTQMVEVSPRQ